ncbi:MAG: hypothetical protein AAB834_05320 [Patescibacteria group bacterium]
MDRSNATKIYNYLNTLNSTLIHSESQGAIRDGSWTRFNSLMAQLATAYNDEMFKDYTVGIHTSHQWGQSVNADEFRRKVYAATAYLHTQYLDEFTFAPERNNRAISAQNGTVVTQNQTAQQQTEVNVEFNVTLMQVTELLTKAENQFPDEASKENRFVKKVKQALPLAKTSVDIITSILRTAKEFGLSPADLLKAFGIHG